MYQNEFVFEDGSTETPKEDLMAMDKMLQGINGETGKIYMVNGARCLCIAPWVSYGGGSRALWAVEGHSAQLTMVGSGYIKGKCLEVLEEPLGIKFQPDGDNFWYSLEPENIGRKTNNQETKFVSLKEIRRYDINWY